jgi:hypothetical protein
VGDRCGLEFVVRAHSPIQSRRRRTEAEAAVEVYGGDQPVHEIEHLFDRLIASYPGRHFHLELETALLEGGGQLRGRLHVGAELSAGVVHVAAQCREGWRTDIRVHNLRHAPLWRDRVLWRESTTIELGSDRRWYGFAFEIPPGLPPAVEGHIISWRYEIDAHHPVRLRPDDRAALTPLRFAIA